MSQKPTTYSQSNSSRSGLKPASDFKAMRSVRVILPGFATVLFLVLLCPHTGGKSRIQDAEEFGPVVRAYLGYLRSEQEVVDDRVSRREVNQAYYRRNSNRIRALREMAIRLARQTHNDYLPELEAVARDEFGLLFHRQPRPDSLKSGEVLQNTFRFMGAVRSGEVFYIFARLDPYEQAELMEAGLKKPATPNPKPANADSQIPTGNKIGVTEGRPRRIAP